MDTFPTRPLGADPPFDRLPAETRRFRFTLSLTGLQPVDQNALRVEEAIEHLPGVLHAYVNPVTEMAYVVYNPELTGEHKIAAAVRSPDFRALTAIPDGAADAG